MTKMQHKKTISSRSVQSFLNNISPTNKRFFETLNPNYIFRGQGNSKWNLIPSAFRSDTETPHEGEVILGFKNSFREQRELEFCALRDFVIEISKHGFHIPDERVLYRLQDFGEFIEELARLSRFEGQWPNNEYFSLLGLAQHFGLPTRLMDWSYSPYVAAYFAARQCIDISKPGDAPNSIAIYALNSNSNLLQPPSLVKFSMKFAKNNHGKQKTTYHVVEAPRYFNHNLLAQKGLFICCTEYGGRPDNSFKPQSLDKYLDERNQLFSSESNDPNSISKIANSDNGVTLYKFTLPAHLASDLLAELDKLFVNSSSIFPGLEGCVKTLYDRCN